MQNCQYSCLPLVEGSSSLHKSSPKGQLIAPAPGEGASGEEHCTCALCVGTNEVTPGHRAGQTPPREEHSTLWVPEQRTWALSPSPAGLLHLQPILPLGLMMVVLSVTVSGPYRLAWIGADGVTAWGSNFTQSDFTPQQFLRVVFSIFS